MLRNRETLQYTVGFQLELRETVQTAQINYGQIMQAARIPRLAFFFFFFFKKLKSVLHVLLLVAI